MAITDIADLTTVKTYLRIPNPSAAGPDDTVIQMLMDAAQKAIEREIGHIVSKTISAERHDGGKCEIWLRELPVLYIQNVEEGWGYYNWELDDQEVNQQPAVSIWAYSLDMPDQGLVTRRTSGNMVQPFAAGRDNIRVDYVVGRIEVPANAVIAFCELVSIWYRQSQMRMGGPNTQSAVGMAYNALSGSAASGRTADIGDIGIPESILEMLKPDRRRPIIG